jgi:hypothetical protein
MARSHWAVDGVRLSPLEWRWRDVAIVTGIAVVATLFPYHRGLHFPFAIDDYTYLTQAAGLDPAPFSLRRWLAVRGYYEMMLRLFGTRVESWHAVGFALHAGLAVGVGAWARRFGASRIAAGVATGLFAASPLAFTVLYWCACIQELGSGMFLLLAAWFLVRSDRARMWSVPLFGAAVLCKESVLAAPLVLGLVFGRRTWRPAAAMLALGFALFVASGLHTRMFDSDRALPYATSYGSNLLVHLATQVSWSAMIWRPYPDRLSTPDASHMLPALVVTAAIALGAIAIGGGARRAVLLAAAWYVALLLPVLPLVQHAFAYYAYLPQIGFVILAAMGVDRLAVRLRASPEARIVAGATAVVVLALCAARNARAHESLRLANSDVPHDSLVRSAASAGALLAAVEDARLPPTIRRVVFLTLPEKLVVAATTPGAPAPGARTQRVRRFPLRDAMRDGDLFALHVPGIVGVWAESLSVRDEAADTRIFYATGFNTILPLDDVAHAYLAQAQGRLMAGDDAGARRDLRRLLEIDPAHASARTILAQFEVADGRMDVARALIAPVDPRNLPEELRPLLAQLHEQLGAAPAPAP